MGKLTPEQQIKYNPKTFLKYPDEFPRTADECKKLAGKRLPSRRLLIEQGLIEAGSEYNPRKDIDRLCPASMRVDELGYLRHKGQGNTPKKHYLQGHEGKMFQKGHKLNNGRKHKSALIKEAMQDLLNLEGRADVAKGEVMSFARELALIRQDMIRATYKKMIDKVSGEMSFDKDGFIALDRIMTGFRIDSGEIPTQKQEISAKKSALIPISGVVIVQPQVEEEQEVSDAVEVPDSGKITLLPLSTDDKSI